MKKLYKYIVLFVLLVLIIIGITFFLNKLIDMYSLENKNNEIGKLTQISVERVISTENNSDIRNIATISINPNISVIKHEKIMDSIIKEIDNYINGASNLPKGVIYIKDANNEIKLYVDLNLKKIYIDQPIDIFDENEIDSIETYLNKNSNWN